MTGRESAAAVLVSNNPYRLGRALGSGTRPRLSDGILGIAVLMPVATGGGGNGGRRLSMDQWTANEFVVEADEPLPAGIDGEAVKLTPPLRFHTRPGALRVRIAPQHPGASPSALEPDTPLQALEALAGIALRGSARELAQAG